MLILKDLGLRKLPELGISNMNFPIADVIKFVSGIMITFSQGGEAKIKSKQFSEFGNDKVFKIFGKFLNDLHS